MIPGKSALEFFWTAARVQVLRDGGAAAQMTRRQVSQHFP
jgi:hypothetical protein